MSNLTGVVRLLKKEQDRRSTQRKRRPLHTPEDGEENATSGKLRTADPVSHAALYFPCMLTSIIRSNPGLKMIFRVWSW